MSVPKADDLSTGQTHLNLSTSYTCKRNPFNLCHPWLILTGIKRHAYSWQFQRIKFTL